MPNEQDNKTIWITGASSGLGLALTKHYLLMGNRVIASARSEGELSQLAKLYPDELSFLAFDVTDTSQIDATRSALESMTDPLHMAILNAGTCEYFDVDAPDWALFERVNQVNYLGMVNSLQVCLPKLKQTANAHLVGVSSQAVQAPFIRSEAYGASKAAVRYLLHSLRLDLAPDDVAVSCILPGFVDTPLTQRNDFDMPFLMAPEQAAHRIANAIEKRVFEYAFPKRLSALLALARLAPSGWFKFNARKRPSEG